LLHVALVLLYLDFNFNATLLAAILPERSLASGNLKLFRRPTSEPEIKMQIGFRRNHSNLGKWLWKNMASNSTTPQAPQMHQAAA